MTLIVLFLAFRIFQAEAPAATQSNIVVTDETIAQSPAVQAICLTGKGDNKAYGDATKQLGEYLVKKNIKPRPIFSTTWTGGPDAKSPQTDAQWDVCTESKPPSDGISPPFELKDIKAQEAGHIVCQSTLANLGQCFAAVVDFVTKSGRTPSTLPRYNIVKDNGADKPGTYEIWLPLSPAGPASPKN